MELDHSKGSTKIVCLVTIYPTGGVESKVEILSVCPSQNHVRPHILYIIGKSRTLAMTSDDNDEDKRKYKDKDKDKDKDKMTKRPNICHIFENDMT